jgi:hypothetical protein
VAKYIPISIVIFTTLIAGVMAGRPKALPAARSMRITILIFLVVWCYLCLNVYPKHVFIE